MAAKPGTLPNWNTGGANRVTPSGAKQILGWVTGGDIPTSGNMNWWMNLVYQWAAYLDDLASQAFTWSGLHVFSLLLTASKGMVISQSTANTDGLVVAGNGTGHGVNSTGGATGFGLRSLGGGGGVYGAATGSGTAVGVQGVGAASGNGVGGSFQGTGTAQGVVGQGGSSNGTGVTGLGNGTASGVAGVGGASGGKGGNFQGGVGGVGVNAQGGAGGSGLNAVGGATAGDVGVYASGGSGGGNGIEAHATSTYFGGDFYSAAGYGLRANGASGNQKGALILTPQSQPTSGDRGAVYFDSGTNKLRVCTVAGTPGTWADCN